LSFLFHSAASAMPCPKTILFHPVPIFFSTSVRKTQSVLYGNRKVQCWRWGSWCPGTLLRSGWKPRWPWQRDGSEEETE